MGTLSAMYRAAESGITYPLDRVVYRDPDGNLLDVVHDMEALKERGPEEWKRLFSERGRDAAPPLNSGVWGKREWVLPGMPDEHVVSLAEGWTGLIRPPHLCRHARLENLWVKLCGNSHTGSFKDLGMTVLVSQVNRLRAGGTPIRAVACASTGDTSAALAAYCARAGIPSVVFLPRGKVSTAQLVQPLSHGSLVLALDTDFDGCMRVVQEVTRDESLYLANSMNPLRIEGQKCVSVEICQQLGWEAPDWVIIPGGNLGNVSALGSGFEMMLELGLISKRPRIAVAQSASANPLYLAWRNGFREFRPVRAGDTLATAIRIGNPVSYGRAVRTLKAFSGVVAQVTEAELADAAHLADRSGLYCCPHTGVAVGALLQLAAKKTFRPGEKVVVISTAHGLKFTEFKTGYHEGRLPGIEGKWVNRVVECPAEADAVRRELDKRLGG